MPLWLGGPWLLPLYVLAVLTDVVDGAVARRTGTATRAGAAFDAWVDKILHVNLGWALAVADLIPDVWLLAWFARELIQAPLVFVLIHRFRTAKAPPPETSLLGRATAVSLFLAVVVTLAGADATLPTAATGVLGLSAGIQYALRYLPNRPESVERPTLPGPPGAY
jgi:CDP-diacylglycerol--glycerol-3-phosphate 3-phosphatidyltransferase